MSGNLVNSVGFRMEAVARIMRKHWFDVNLSGGRYRAVKFIAHGSHTAYLGDIKWEKKCPSVTWDEGTWNTCANYVASRSFNLFSVTLMNPDPMRLWSDDYVDGDTKERIT